VRALNGCGLKITSIEDVTPIRTTAAVAKKARLTRNRGKLNGAIYRSYMQACRREGTDLFLKSGAKPLESKWQVPGAARRVKSERRQRLFRLRPAAAREAEAAPHVRVLERQFVATTSRRRAAPEPRRAAAQALESRLDNVVYRMGFAATRAEARQLVSHKAIEVNSGIVSIASNQCRAGDVVQVRERARKQLRIQGALASGAHPPSGTAEHARSSLSLTSIHSAAAWVADASAPWMRNCFAGALPHLHDITRAALIRGDRDDAAVDLDGLVAHELARLGARRGKGQR